MWIIVCVWYVDNGERFERLVESLLMLFWIMLYYENGCNIMKMVISSFFVNISFALFWDMVVISVMCIEKEWEIKEDVPSRVSYHAPRWILYFEGRIAHRGGYYISTDVSRVAMVTIIEGGITRRDGCIDICPPWVHDWETAGLYH